MIGELINILEEERAHCAALIELLQEEKRLLATRSKEPLLELSQRIERAVFKSRRLETLRSGLVAAMLSGRDIGASEGAAPTLVDIIKLIEEPDRGMVRDLRDTLRAQADVIMTLNKENSIIIDKGLANIKAAFEFLNEVAAIGGYGAAGTITNSYGRG